MKKLIAIATAGCMLMAASAPALAAPAAPAPQVATAAKPMPMIGTRSQLVQRAATTPQGQSSKFLAIRSVNSALVSIAALFSIVVGSYAASGGFDGPGSS